jgi:hypothetical protein
MFCQVGYCDEGDMCDKLIALFNSEFKLSHTVSFQPNVQVMGDSSHELNKFDLGDGDIAILGLKMSKKMQPF